MFSLDNLYRDPVSVNETEYPSPESLARKILIKGGKNSKKTYSSIIHYSVTETPSNKSEESAESVDYIEEEIEIDSENEETDEKEEGKIEFELRDSVIGDVLTTKMFMMPKKVCILKILNYKIMN